MEAFCANTLTSTQCNGLTRAGLGAVGAVGVVHGTIGFALAIYLAASARKSLNGSKLAWVVALEGLLYSTTAMMEAAGRFRPGSLERFSTTEKATAGLGYATLVMTFVFHIYAASTVANRNAPKLVLLLVPALAVPAGFALAFNIFALQAISYEEHPTGIRAGMTDLHAFVDPEKKALVAMVSFVSLTAFVYGTLDWLARRERSKVQASDAACRRKAMSVFSASTVQEPERGLLHDPAVLRLGGLLTACALGVLKHALTFASANTIVPRRAVGMAEYSACAWVVLHFIRVSQSPQEPPKNFFGQLRTDPSYAPSIESLSVERRTDDDGRHAVLTNVTFGSLSSAAMLPKTHALDSKRCGGDVGVGSGRARAMSGPGTHRESQAAQSAFSSLAPEDSASTAAFMPRPPPPPPHLRTRTTHGPNGSELTPLRESLLQRFKDSGPLGTVRI